jgi:hypothetical protein
MKTVTKKLTRKEKERATAQRHHDVAWEPGKPWFEWTKLYMCRACVNVRGQALLRALEGP